MADEKWIRPATTVDALVPETDGMVQAHGINYSVKRVRVPTMDYNPAIEVAGTIKPMKTKGPFQIGPMSIGKVYSEADGFIDADWYFELF